MLEIQGPAGTCQREKELGNERLILVQALPVDFLSASSREEIGRGQTQSKEEPSQQNGTESNQHYPSNGWVQTGELVRRQLLLVPCLIY